MPLHRVCSECGGPLGDNPKQKTCSDKCRGDRSRRLARSKKKGGPRADQTGFQALAPAAGAVAVEDVARDVLREELAPVVREAITEDALRAIQKLIALTPEMVDKLATDLRSTDDVVRQKAYTLGLRYTIGHGSIVPPPGDADPGNKLTVIFDGMARPDFDAPADAEVVEETRTCNGCGAEKAADQFVGHSDRCTDCHEALRARAEALLTSEIEAAPVADVKSPLAP